jgi:hypothetical protein
VREGAAGPLWATAETRSGSQLQRRARERFGAWQAHVGERFVTSAL